MNREDGPVITRKFKDDRNVIVYINENEFRKREHAIKKYFMGAYKYWIFEVIPKLQKENKVDGQYELELPVSELFKKVYGNVRVLFSVKNDVVILEDIKPSEILTDMHRKELPTYKGVPYRNKKDKFKIELLKE